MPYPAPILSYATPSLRPPVYLAVILYLWAAFDFLASIFFTIASCLGIEISFGAPLPFAIFTACFFLSGPALLIWSLITFQYAYRIHHAEFDAFESAHLTTLIAEIITWTLAAGFSILYLVNLSLWTRAENLVVLALVLSVPTAVTATRLLLRHAARRLPTPAEPSASP